MTQKIKIGDWVEHVWDAELDPRRVVDIDDWWLRLDFLSTVSEKMPVANYRVVGGVDEDSISYSELAELTHVTQVARFNFCTCEDLDDGQEAPYSDCPTREEWTQARLNNTDPFDYEEMTKGRTK